VKPAPGGSAQATVRMPAINILAKHSNGTTFGNARVVVTTNDAGCDQTFALQHSTAAGAIPLPAYPFGNYRVCIDDGVSLRSNRTNVENASPAGTATITVQISRSGLCA
jgi:hypothetical protein